MSLPRTTRAGALLHALPLVVTLLTGTGLLTGSLGCSTSSNSNEKVYAPTINAQPANATVVAGSPASFVVAASGSAPLTYQWSKGGTAVSGASSPIFTIAATTAADAGSYTVTVSNSGGTVTSSAATLTVAPAPIAPAITTQPASATVTAGSPASFTVAASGTSPFTYQWKQNGNVVGGNTATLSIAAAAASDAGSYTVTVSNAVGSVTSTAATLTVNPLILAPAITAQPASQTVTVGQPATLSVTATGTAPLSYQWLKGSAAVGGNSSSFTLAAAALGDAGSYSVKVSNAAGSVTSAAATLTVNAVAAGVTGPANQTALDGATATFTVTGSGTGPLTYAWTRNGVAITGAAAASYTTPALVYATDNNAKFICTVTNVVGQSAVSSAATLTVTPIAPALTTAPVAQTVVAGSPASFTAAATGTAPLSFQWYENSTALANGTGATLTIASPALTENGAAITVKVTNGAGQTVTSSPVLLTVNAPAQPPVITAQPKTVTVRPPDGTTFTVTATGTGLTYTWKKNGIVIAGATNASYTVASTDLHNVIDSYLVTVGNASGLTVDSQAAVLNVVAPKPVYAGDPTAPGNSNYSVWPSWFATAPADNSGSFRFGYDTGKMAPLWSASCFFPSAGFTFTRPATYPDDTRVVGSLTSSDYTNSGYARGHQTGFADLRDHYGADAGASSMYMTNMCAQDQTFNGGSWSDFENMATITYPAAFGRIWVYTGPIYGPAITAPIGAKNIPVATAFYKIMVRETAAGVPKVLAAIVPHSSTLGKPGVLMTSTDFWKFVTTVDRVQQLTGLTFFPSPSSPLPANFTSTVDVAGWGAPLEQGPGKPNVYLITPNWDTEFKHVDVNTNVVTLQEISTATAGTAVAFQALATPDPDAIVSTAWNFGDGSATDANLSTSHAFAKAGDYTVTFTATDAASHTSSIARVVTITSSGNTPPVFSPAILPSVSVAFNTAGTQTFTLSDDSTPAAAITVAGTSDTQSLLPNANITSAFNAGSGAWSLTLTPVTGQSGTAVVTVTATDQNGASTIKTFNFVVAPAPVVGTATLIISQYYEGTSNNKWIEVTNVGSGTYDSTVSTIYLGQWNNPRTTNAFHTIPLTGTLAPGASLLIRNTSAILPANAYNGGAGTAKNGARILVDASSSVANFNGNDVVYLSTSAAAATTDTTSFANRTDVIGAYLAPGNDQTMADWDPITPVIIPAGWGVAATPPGQDRSFVRNGTVLLPNPTYTPSEWTQVDAVQITATALGLCETVATTDSRYLGYHSYTGGNP